MRESLGRVQHGSVAASEFLAVPLAASRRIRAQVDDYVVNGALRAAHQFGFLVGFFLVVHTANCTPPEAECGVELEHVGIQAMLNELFAAPGSREISPVILNLFLSDQEGAFKCCFDEFHK